MGVVQLRQQAEVGQPGAVTVAEGAGVTAVGQQRFHRRKALGNPVQRPLRACIGRQLQTAFQILHHPQIVDRVDVAGHQLGQCPHPRAAGGVGRQQRYLRKALVQVFKDRQRLSQHMPLM